VGRRHRERNEVKGVADPVRVWIVPQGYGMVNHSCIDHSPPLCAFYPRQNSSMHCYFNCLLITPWISGLKLLCHSCSMSHSDPTVACHLFILTIQIKKKFLGTEILLVTINTFSKFLTITFKAIIPLSADFFLIWPFMETLDSLFPWSYV
jgi:hypothetical protein